jgi:hypothetical protein
MRVLQEEQRADDGRAKRGGVERIDGYGQRQTVLPFALSLMPFL